MLDNMKMLGALGGLLKNRDKLQGAGQRVKDRLAGTRVIGKSPDGQATAHCLASMQVEKLELSPQLAQALGGDEASRLRAQQAICLAVNDGLKQAQAKVQEVIDGEMKGLGLEGGLPDVAGLRSILGS
jgi:DNA-binding protein YbaB